MNRRYPHAAGFRNAKFELLEDRRMLAVLTVNSFADSASNIDNGTLTLREAIAVVNDAYNPFLINGDLLQIDDLGGAEPIGTNDKIVFAQSLSGKTIRLDEGISGPTQGKELTITNSVIIDATMLSSLTIAGTGGTDGNVPATARACLPAVVAMHDLLWLRKIEVK